MPTLPMLHGQADFFLREGYLVVPGLFDAQEVGEIRDIFARIHAEGVPGRYERGQTHDAISDPNDPLFQYPRVIHPHRYDDRVRHFLTLPKVAEYLRAFFGEEPAAAQSMFYFKPPGARGQALHQDQLYLLVEPGNCVAAWTAIDDCDQENGAILVVPNTGAADVVCPDKANERESFSAHFVPVPKGLKPQLLPMKAGDTLFFNGNLIHGSGPNRSTSRFRRSFIGHYVPASTAKIAEYYVPLVSMAGEDFQIATQTGGGACGDVWKGSQH